EDLRDQAARHRFVRAVRAVAPNASGATVEMTEGGRAVIDAYRQAAATAVVAIALLLLVLLRRLAAVVLVLAPLLLAAVLTVAATVVFALPFNFANVIVLPLLFGLGVASGLHIELRARQAGPQRVLSTSTPRAVLFSALTTVASFGALALSRHTGTASMGVLLTIAICLTLVSTLVVLPALLHEAGRWRQAR
ncbi:MAG: MMPL family transporter, partial [Kiloniellales bacterium]|nr:MMPL family transporter [Kiloniellales bacterium]